MPRINLSIRRRHHKKIGRVLSVNVTNRNWRYRGKITLKGVICWGHQKKWVVDSFGVMLEVDGDTNNKRRTWNNRLEIAENKVQWNFCSV